MYLYFQLPLMILIIAPAIDGLKKEWREAAENLGATSRQYWRHVALPILMPSLLGTAILLFGNAFGAQATAYQLTGGTIPIVAVKIGAQISGDVLHNVGLGYAMAMAMVVVMCGRHRALPVAPAEGRALDAMTEPSDVRSADDATVVADAGRPRGPDAGAHRPSGGSCSSGASSTSRCRSSPPSRSRWA